MSASNRLCLLLRVVAFISLLAGLALPGAAMATVLRFSQAGSAAGVVQDGQLGSVDIPGITLQIMNVNSATGGAVGSLQVQDNDWLYSDEPSLVVLTHDSTPGYNGMAIKSSDGRVFALHSLQYYNWGETDDATIQIVGYKGGGPVAGAMVSFQWMGPTTVSRLVTFPPAFEQVDDVRILLASGGSNNGAGTWHSVNNLDVSFTNTAPTALLLSGNTVNHSGGINAVVGTLSSTDPDPGSTFTYSLVTGVGSDDNASFNLVGNSLRAINAASLPAGNRSVRIRTTDDAGATFERAFTITVVDDVAPSVVSIAPANGQPSTATNVDFAVTFSEAVSGVSTDDFTLVGTGSASGAIVSVSGSGASYVLTVSGITGTGTLKLNLNGSTNVVDGGGNATPAYSAGGTHTVAVPTAPGAPTINGVTASNAQAQVSFSAPASDGGSAISSYTLTASPGGSTVSGSASPLVMPGLTNGTTYTFTVTATNSAGTGALSGSSLPVTPRASQSISFINPGAQNFGTSPTLGATASSGLPVAFSSSTSSVCTITSGGALTFVTAGTCTIDADQPGNTSTEAASTQSRSFTVNAVVPGAPTIGTATAGDSTASVSFIAPASNGGHAITGYTVTANPGGMTAAGGGSPLQVSGLTNGVAYTFTATATNSAGTGAASAASNPVTPAAAQIITFANPGAQNFGTTPTLSATSDSGLNPVFSSSTTAVCTITTGGALTFISAGSCAINADQPGNSSYLPADRVSRTFTVNAVAPDAPTTVIATPSGTGEIRVAFNAPASNGGAAISQYRVTSTPGGVVADGAGSPIAVTGLATGQSYTFTVTAINSAGNSAPSAASNAALAADALVTRPSSTTFAYGTAATFALDYSGLPTQVIVVTPPTHGTLTFNGLQARYAPRAGYGGPDQFVYQLTDGNLTSAAATVSLTVSAPTIVLDTGTPPPVTAGSAYAQPLAVSGGTAPYTYAVVGALPAGMALSATGELSGTPTAAGTYTFSISITDSSTGEGPYTVLRPYTLQVAAPQIGFTLAALPQSVNAAPYNQPLQVSGGSAPYAFRLASGALPAGLTLEATGMLSGTPTAAGTYAFAVEVSDANGFTATAPYELVVAAGEQQITGFAANPTAPTYSMGGTFAVSASGGASGNPVLFTSTTPTVCSVQGATVSMLTAGRCSLSAAQQGNAQYLAAPTQNYDVDISAAVPVLEWAQDLQKMFGEASFELVDPRSPSQGAFSYTSSDTSVASVQGRTVTLHGEGSTVITVTQAAAGSYTAASAQLQLRVTARPDPTRDPGVVAGLQAQVDASVRFASAQQGNIRDRLRQVRSGSNTSSNQLALNYAGDERRQGMTVPLSATGTPALPAGWGMWAAGTASFGKGDRRGSYDFSSDGLTIGVDHALGEQLLLGVAASVARNDSDMDASDSRVQARQHSLAAYGLWRTGDHLFVDGVIANGALDFTTRRWSQDVAAFGRGSRDGDQWFGSVSFGYEHRGEGIVLTGYGRIEASRTTLDAYQETGLASYDLAYRRQQVENSAVALGLEGSFLQADANSRVRPFWNLEYREAIDDKGQAYLNYVTAPRADDYRLDMRSYNDHALSIGAGMDVRLQRGWLLSVLFGHEQTRGSSSASSVGLRLTYGGAGKAGAGAGGATVGGSDAPHCSGNRRTCARQQATTAAR